MKVVFLDVDGVLNTKQLISETNNFAIGSEQLDRLSFLILATGAKIVLTSTWRLYKKHVEHLQATLASRNLKIFGTTDDLSQRFDRTVPRADEILSWLVNHPEVSEYAILDDASDAGYSGLTNHFFQTSFHVGLTDEIMHQAINHLGAA